MKQREFEILATELRQQALATAQALTANGPVVEDVAQDTMLKLWAMHDDLRDAAHARRMARLAARQLSIDLLRSRQRTQAMVVPMDDGQGGHPTGWTATDDDSPQSRMEAEEDARWLRQRIARLPTREMQVMEMRQGEGRPNEEIARIMGIASASVATMLSAARRKIFEELKKRNET